MRELRQNASVLLDRVYLSGVSIEITNHGKPVAMLTPLPSGSASSRDELIEQGLLRPGVGDVLDVRPASLPEGVDTAEILNADRGDR